MVEGAGQMALSQGRLAQRESAAFTRQRSLVRNQQRPPLDQHFRGCHAIRGCSHHVCTTFAAQGRVVRRSVPSGGCDANSPALRPRSPSALGPSATPTRPSSHATASRAPRLRNSSRWSGVFHRHPGVDDPARPRAARVVPASERDRVTLQRGRGGTSSRRPESAERRGPAAGDSRIGGRWGSGQGKRSAVDPRRD
jgi:hypothetical protein